MKKTKIIKMNPKKFKKEEMLKLGKELRNGKTVVFPTETVYGLGANALDENAVNRIFVAKGRPSDNPLIIHIAEISQLKKIVEKIPKIAEKLMIVFWPGPLTLILKKKATVNSRVSGGLNTVAVRMPKNRIAMELIRASRVPIAAPSANTSGRPSPTEATHTIADLKDKVDYIIDGGKTELGLESTVVDTTAKKVRILRHGSITQEEIEAIIGQKIQNESENKVVRSPGVKYKHYAPMARMLIIKGSEKDVFKEIEKETKKAQTQDRKVGVMCFEKHNHEAQVVCFAGNKNKERGKNIFSILRKFDSQNVDIIFCESIEEHGMGRAIMDRLKKAAGHNIVLVPSIGTNLNNRKRI